jgi:hypothetical protein
MLSSLLRAGGFSCNLDVLHGGLVKIYCNFDFKKKPVKFRIFGHPSPGSVSGSAFKPVRIHTLTISIEMRQYMYSFSNNGYGKLALSALTQKLFTLYKYIYVYINV